jgi:hypothetical protein
VVARLPQAAAGRRLLVEAVHGASWRRHGATWWLAAIGGGYSVTWLVWSLTALRAR